MRPVFNYIITIHNKEDLIEVVLNSVIKCCHENSSIYTVLDGCSDGTEEIINRIMLKNKNVKIRKVYTANVHETKSINAGLQNSDQTREGFNIILQDDVIFSDFQIEQKVEYIYKWSKTPLGIISFRMGANFRKNWLISKENVPFKNLCENIYGHATALARIILEGQFCYRAFPFKSPICIPCEIVNQYGLLDERLSPHTYDDVDYSIKLILGGYRNGVFALRFKSKKEWGGTRRNSQNVSIVQERNINLIRNWYGNLSDEKEFYGVDMKIYNTVYYKFYNLKISQILTIIKHILISFLYAIKSLVK